jgi:hypothetical protein
MASIVMGIGDWHHLKQQPNITALWVTPAGVSMLANFSDHRVARLAGNLHLLSVLPGDLSVIRGAVCEGLGCKRVGIIVGLVGVWVSECGEVEVSIG